MPPRVSDEEDKKLYTLYKSKIKKVDKILGKLRVVDGKEDTKEYRGYERKKKKYQKELEKTREYKSKKLQNALDDLHTSLHSVDLSIMEHSSSHHNGDDDDSSSSSGSSSSSSSSDDSIDYPNTLKKFDKVERMLKELIEDHGEEEAKSRSDYQKYKTKRAEYLRDLEKTKQWAKEKDDRKRAEMLRLKRKEAEEEADREEEARLAAVAAAKAQYMTELEAEKQKALEKIRKKKAKEEEKERVLIQAAELAKKVKDEEARKQMQQLDNQANQIEEVFMSQLKEQEDKGMIIINSRKSK